MKDEGNFRGEVISSSDGDLIQDNSINIQFESDDGLIFFAETTADEGLFGYSDYGRIDLPNGVYSVVVNLDGYELFEEQFVVDGDTDKYTISLNPISVNATLEVTYTNATGIKLPISNADVKFTNDFSDYEEIFSTDQR